MPGQYNTIEKLYDLFQVYMASDAEKIKKKFICMILVF